MEWITTEESLKLDGFVGKDLWLDPEANSFVRFRYGTLEQHIEIVTNMINRAQEDYSKLPSNYHLSVAKMISDIWEVSTSEIDYGVDILHVMDCTRFLSEHTISGMAKHWPVWDQARFVFEQSTATLSTRSRSEGTYQLVSYLL